MAIWNNRNVHSGGLGSKTVAYFCAEYGITDILPIYSGGLGILAGDIVQEAAALQLPFVAVGLFYKKGFFHQHSTPQGQQEIIKPIDPLEVPLELVKDEAGNTLLIEVPVQERTVYAQIWRFPVGANSLYLLDTDHWKNSPSDREITDQLYGGDQAKRIQQELVLGIGGKRALDALDIKPDLYHMNEGHSAFLALEILRDHLPADGNILAHPDALKQAAAHLVFTNHTLVSAGNDVFSHDLIRYYLGKYAFESGIGIETVLNLGALNTQPGYFAMTMLAMRASTFSNAVSKLHAKKAAELWPEFKFKSVTNGVHLPAWVAPEFQQRWETAMPTWASDTSNRNLWKAVTKLSPEVVWATHQHLKVQLLDEVYARTGIRLEEDTLTVVWARRFTPYKRPDLLFSDIERLKKLLFDEKRPIQVIVAGKSHPADEQGKRIMQHIEDLANFDLKHRVVFVDDYSISLAKFLVSGADVWLNTPIFGLEASGTSGMKAAANGVVQCTVPDGWAYEVNWQGIGFTLPADKTETEIYPLFEKKIIPTYYRKNAAGLSELWTLLMRETIAAVSPQFSSKRMVDEYVSQLYLPALAQQTS